MKVTIKMVIRSTAKKINTTHPNPTIFTIYWCVIIATEEISFEIKNYHFLILNHGILGVWSHKDHQSLCYLEGKKMYFHHIYSIFYMLFVFFFFCGTSTEFLAGEKKKEVFFQGISKNSWWNSQPKPFCRRLPRSCLHLASHFQILLCEGDFAS